MKFWNDIECGPYLTNTLTEILDEGCTDSDLEDFANTYNVDEGDVFRFAAHYRVKGTPCEGCKNCGLFPHMYPCNSCTKSPRFRDMYEKEELED